MLGHIDREQQFGSHEKPGNRENARHIIAAIESRHGIALFLSLDDHNTDDRCDQPQGPGDQGKNDPFDSEVRIESDAENHRADVFRGGGFKQIGAAAGAVTDVVADQVGDHRGITRIVLRDAGLNFADEIGAHVSGFCVNTATELGEQRDKRSTEPITDDGERDLLRIVAQGLKQSVEAADSQ